MVRTDDAQTRQLKAMRCRGLGADTLGKIYNLSVGNCTGRGDDEEERNGGRACMNLLISYAVAWFSEHRHRPARSSGEAES
jgi:hypothetical protein